MEGKEGNLKLKKGFWKPEEDLILKEYVESHGEGNWTVVSNKSGLMRGAKSCRLRWKNYLRPNIKRGIMSQDEKDLIIRLHKLLGNRWSLIAGRLPGRTDNEVKNYWNTHLNKRPSRAQIQEPPAVDPNLSLQTPATTSPPDTKIEGQNIDCWIDNFKIGDMSMSMNMSMHPDYESYNYMPIFDDFDFSASFHHSATTATTTATAAASLGEEAVMVMHDETIFDFCSFINN